MGFDQICIHSGCMAPAIPHFPKVRLLPIVKVSAIGFRPIEQITNGGICQQIMSEDTEGRQLLRPGRAAAIWHDNGAIPMQHGHGAGQRRLACEFLLELAVSGHGYLTFRHPDGRA